MKKHILFILLYGATTLGMAQETKEAIMEKRAREMHRVLGIDDPAQWRKFIQENYTQTLIDKPMRATVQSDGGDVSKSESNSANNLEEKTKIFQRLYDDFGQGKILSLKTKGDNVEMVIAGEMGLKGTFKLNFDPAKPHLISGLGIEAGN